MSDLVARLKAACVGHPDAKIPWPHRLLHEAADELTALRVENERLQQLLSWQYSDCLVGGLRNLNDALRARVKELEAERNLLPHMPISGAMRREWERYMLRPFDSAAEDAFRAMLRAALEGREK